VIGAIASWQSWLVTTAGVLVVIALLYLLRPRRRQIQVPFGGLWQRVLAQAEARALGRRWRRLLSMLLMVAIAALMLAALGLPLFGTRGCTGQVEVQARHTVLLIDTSASMATQDGVPVDSDGDELIGQRLSRLDEARARLQQVIISARPGERFLIMSAAGRLRTRGGWTSDRATLLRTLATIEPGQAALSLRRAWAAAVDAVAGRAGPSIVLVSDGGPAIESAPAPESVPVKSIMVGPAVRTPKAAGFDNLAVERVGIRPDPADPGRGVLTVRVRNDRDQPVVARVTVAGAPRGQSAADFSAPEALKMVRGKHIPAHSGKSLTFNDLEMAAGRFAVRIQPQEGADWRDLASYDDFGFAVLAERKELTVLQVGPGNMFLTAALLANPRVALKNIYDVRDYRPEDWAAAHRKRHGVDIVLLDRVAAAPPPGMPHLRFDPVAHAHTLAGSTFVGGPDLFVPPGEHTLSRGFSLQDANADRVRLLEVPTGAKVLIRARHKGAVAVASVDGFRRLVIGMDLLDTDLGGRFALPILIGNAIDWLAGEDEALLSPLDLGRVWAIQAPVRGLTWTYREPGGQDVPARIAGDQIIASSEAHGIHRWLGADGSTLARPTRLAATERPGLRAPLSSAWEPVPAAEQARNQPAPRPIWQWLLLLALGTLFIEWPLYVRRRTV